MVKKEIILNEKISLHDKILKEKVDVEKFKKLIKEMYKGFPNFEYRGMVEKIITTEKVREELEKAKFLIKEEFADREGNLYNMYMLGPSALPLISAWKTEDLTKKIKTLTIWILVITGIALLINIINLFLI